jgi:L-lactate utilization protein LutC
LTNQVCITGCSRTADIEKLLVVPAHGPRQVRVILSRTPIDWVSLLLK